MTSLAETLDLLQKLIALDTTPDKDFVPVLDFVEGLLRAHGATTTRFLKEGGRIGTLIAHLGPRIDGGIMMSGHLDVVSVQGQNWASDPFVLTERDGKLFGRGACDMKGFIACVLALLPEWAAQKRATPISFAFTTDEETDNDTIRDLVAQLKDEPKPSLTIVGEPTNMNLVTAHKGTHCFWIDIQGKPAHSSRPDLGISAIEIAHEIIGFYRGIGKEFETSLVDPRFAPPYATINLGQIQGGTAFNIVPEHCALRLQMRQILNAQAWETEKKLRTFIETTIAQAYPGAKIAMRSNIFYALEPRDDTALLARVQAARPEAEVHTAPFATEGGFLQQNGQNVIVCGPGSIEQAHKQDEFVAKDQLDACLSFLRALTA